MNTPLTLRECLVLWQKDLGSQALCAREELFELVEGSVDPSSRDDLLYRLCRSPGDRKRLWEMLRFLNRRQQFHVAIPKAAADRSTPESFSIFTEGKRYQLIYRRLLGEEDEGVLTLSVNPTLRDQVRDCFLSVIDNTGSEVLRGKLENGELSRRVKNTTRIQWQTLVVREEEDD
jgi:hypothetical protein